MFEPPRCPNPICPAHHIETLDPDQRDFYRHIGFYQPKCWPRRVSLAMEDVQKPVVLGNRLFFAAYHVDSGTELWETNGTSGGTVLVAEVEPGRGGHITGFVAVGSRRGAERCRVQ